MSQNLGLVKLDFRHCFLETLNTKFDQEIISQYYLSNPNFVECIDKSNLLIYKESIDEDVIQCLYSLLDTFTYYEDIQLIGSKEHTSKNGEGFIDGFGYEGKTLKSLKLEITRLLKVYLESNKKDLVIGGITHGDTKSYLAYYRETSFLWDYISKHDKNHFKEALDNSKLCLAKAQEVLFCSQEKEELEKFQNQNKCNFSVLSMLSYGVYKLYDGVGANKLTLSKKQYYTALAYHYHLKNRQLKEEIPINELFDYSVLILKTLATLEVSKDMQQVKTLLETYHQNIQNVLRTHGYMESHNVTSYPKLKHRILVTMKRPAMLDNNLVGKENLLPFYSYFEASKEYRHKESLLLKNYQNSVDYNLKNLIDFILQHKCQNLITFNSEAVVSEFKQIEELLNEVIPQKRRFIKESIERNKNFQMVKEASNFLKIGYKIDSDNKKVFTNLKKEYIFQKPVLSVPKLLRYLKNEKKYEETLVDELVSFLDTLNKTMNKLIELKTVSIVPFVDYLNERSPNEARYDKNFDFENAFNEYTKTNYKERFDETLQKIDRFLLEQSNSNKCIADEFSPEDLVDDKIHIYNSQIHQYHTLRTNVTAGIKFYTDIEKSLGIA